MTHLPNIPSATVSRMVMYLRILEQLETRGINRTSSGHLAEQAQVSAFQVRKDLAYFGRFGTRGMGYTVSVLKREIRRVLGLNRPWNVIVFGMGRLGQAIAHYPGTLDYGFNVVGLFDVDPNKVGQTLRHLTIRNVSECATFVRGHPEPIDMALLAVPTDKAQESAQKLVELGIKGILNFSPIVLQPRIEHNEGQVRRAAEWRDVIVENMDFLTGMKRLAFYILNPALRELDQEVQL